MNNKVIVLPTSSFLPDVGGMEIGLHNIAIKLIDKGYKPILLIPLKNFLMIKINKLELPYNIFPFLPKLNFMLRYFEKFTMLISNLILAKINKQNEIHIFHITSCYPIAIPIINFARKNKIPVIVRAVGADIQIDKSINYGMRINDKVDKQIKKWLPKSNLLIATTNTIKDEYKKLNINDDKIINIPNGVDLKYFKSIEAPLQNKSVINFITVGRYHKKKGFETLIRAIKNLKENGYNNFRVSLVGSKLEEKLFKLCADLDILENINFVDNISANNNDSNFSLPAQDLVKLYKSSDVFVLPSLVESFGIVLVEAMASELPIITTDGPGCRDVINNGEFGYMVKAGDSNELSKAMIKFISNRKIRNYYREKSFEGVKNYDWNDIVDQYIKLYNNNWIN